MEPPELISLASLLGACLAALYARWSANAARQQNEITLHAERLKVFRCVITFALKFETQSPSITEDDVTAFNEWVELSEFYFNKQIFNALSVVLLKARIILSLEEQWQNTSLDSREIMTSLKDQQRALHNELLEECTLIRDEIKKSLRVSNA